MQVWEQLDTSWREKIYKEKQTDYLSDLQVWGETDEDRMTTVLHVFMFVKNTDNINLFHPFSIMKNVLKPPFHMSNDPYTENQ